MNQTTSEVRDSAETRLRILEVAERLFAERGFDVTSLRTITAEAEVNLAAVNYHFHGKDRLYGEVLRRVIAAKRDRHLDAMETILRHTGKPCAGYLAPALTHTERTLDLFAEAGMELTRLESDFRELQSDLEDAGADPGRIHGETRRHQPQLGVVSHRKAVKGCGRSQRDAQDHPDGGTG